MPFNRPSRRTNQTNPFKIDEAFERRLEELDRQRKEVLKRFEELSSFNGVAELGAALLGRPPMTDAGAGVEPFRPGDPALSSAALAARSSEGTHGSQICQG